MYKINNISLPLGYTSDSLSGFVADKINTANSNVKNATVIKRSIDARKKDQIKYVSSIVFDLENTKIVKSSLLEEYVQLETSIDKIAVEQSIPLNGAEVVVVGSGPAGLFSALTVLARGGKPIIIERGYEMARRVLAVDNLQSGKGFDTVSNIQFGEGGAGTFSDGKLNTGTKSEYIKSVLTAFVKNGANEDIAYVSNPHIGTDVLRDVVVNMRNEIINLGGRFLFGTKVDRIIIKNNTVTGVGFSGENVGEINAKAVILAVGHSARDTFEVLRTSGVAMEQKAFSMGVRIEHKQAMINKSQYGVEKHPLLPTADYKLATHMANGRGVYTFCMCPGGEVVCGSSEEGQIVTNGMSYRKRDRENSNSALLVGVNPSDFGSDDVLAGVEFQRKYEKLAYAQSNSYRAPVQKLGDLRNNKVSSKFGTVKASYKPGTIFGDLKMCLPKYIIDGILFGTEIFDRKIRGFNSSDALLTGVETRSSSPVRILRDELMESNIKGLYPCGEGAGYAGGITSAAVDGIKVALKI